MIEEPIRGLTNQEEPIRKEPTTPVAVEAAVLPLPKEQNHSSLEKMLKRMAKAYRAIHPDKSFLPLGGKQRLFDLGKTYGEETVERCWNRWLDYRNLEELNCPLILFADEFDLVGDATEEEEAYAQMRRLNAEAQQADADEAKREEEVIAWAEQLRAVAEKSTLNDHERGTDGWEQELYERAKKNPPPVPYLNSLDWRADETLVMEIEAGKEHYKRAHNPEYRAAVSSFNLLSVLGSDPSPALSAAPDGRQK